MVEQEEILSNQQFKQIIYQAYLKKNNILKNEYTNSSKNIHPPQPRLININSSGNLHTFLNTSIRKTSNDLMYHKNNAKIEG